MQMGNQNFSNRSYLLALAMNESSASAKASRVVEAAEVDPDFLGSTVGFTATIFVLLVIYSPSPECPVACHGDEWRGEPSEALAKEG